MKRRTATIAVVCVLISLMGGWMVMSNQDDYQAMLAERLKVRWTNVPKKVLAFYYGWYGNPKVSGRWHHWEDVDEEKKTIGSSTHWPALGPYDSHDPSVLEAHCRMAKGVGIDGFIFSWWHIGDFHDKGLPLLLDAANKFGVEVTIYFETVPNRDRQEALRYVVYLLNTYARHPAWMKLNGKPVLFIYGRAIGEIGLDNWLWVIREAEKQWGPAVFIGDSLSPKAAQIFDGIHTYNPTGETAGKNPEELREWAKDRYNRWVQIAGPNRIACVTIIPGYDDHKLPDRKPPRPITERHGGKTYEVLWESALEANPDWVLITSWNEWHEGSEIEPSKEHGDRELKATRIWSEKFKALPPRKRE
ncbi:MAG: glycoside hydrolase family 99-like domain-containing protein [Armatimonadetes bacterium]|nr:glycoside hydrolase family 99-like domain-containing protein [Armatimonadota bacterium]MDW8121089.1 glycoside hydrolase family 99-like domain-containing protein [Armatimonadota bacterium]